MFVVQREGRAPMRSFSAAATALLSLESKDRLTLDESFVKSLLEDRVVTRRLEEWRQNGRRVESMDGSNRPVFQIQHRRFGAVEGDDELESPSSPSAASKQACDAAFLNCLPNDKCITCFASLQTEGIDWASVAPNTPCPDVANFLFDGGHCTGMKGDQNSIDTFCSTFDSCVVWDDDDRQNKGGSKGKSDELDCDALTKCEWDGFHSAFIGDGVCHEAMGGCYNHKVCGYDGGDCCQDTCEKNAANLAYVTCGGEGYACKDPSSKNCDPTRTSTCENAAPGGDSDKKNPADIDCGLDQVLYRLVMYDSFGDGWDETKLTLTPKDDASKVVFNGSLKDGAEGTEYVCLSATPACYHVQVSGGMWGNEVSWELKPVGKGSPAIADGGSPMDCEFSVGGEVCMRTCNGKTNKKIDDDPDYKTYKEMYNCIADKCVIQLGACTSDEACAPCMSQEAPEYCFANSNFNAVVDCALCHCTDGEETEFCQEKVAPGAVLPPDGENPSDSAPAPCSASQTLKGSAAVMAFSECSNFDSIGMMITEFDESNFGALDAFESCSHSFKSENHHGGMTALGCMKILADAIEDPARGSSNANAPTDAISALASLLYHKAEDFCDCARKASEDCPLCPSFLHFKTLLYESLDACQALDEIDCDAWNEFYTPCNSNLAQMFGGSVDFTDPKQCAYAQDTCGGAGPFPAFRKLDCDREIPKEAWDFYIAYERGCLKGDKPAPPEPAPKPVPTAAPKSGPTPYSPKPAPVHPSDNNSPSKSDTRKPYVPSSPAYVPPEARKKRHFLRNICILGAVAGAAYIYHKRRSGSFDFVRYRRARNYGGDDEMYSSLAMESGSSSFEPPTLPPTPMATMT